MIALDTNILVRYFTRDDPAQAAKALRFMESRNAVRPVFISLIVLVELVWVLERNYSIPRSRIVEYLRLLLTGEAIVIERPEMVHEALATLEKRGADFADLLIAAIARTNGCTTTYTFDRKASRDSGFTLLS